MGYYEKFKNLEGKRIYSVECDEKTLRFNHEPNDATVLEAYGDCCSCSYIESLDNPEIFKDAIFDSVEIIEGESKKLKDDDGNDHLQWTFYKFKTNKGMCTLSFRNESNGYYSVWLE